MKWISVNDYKPNEKRMVVGKTIGEPIVQFVIVNYEPTIDAFIDYDDCAYNISHWAYLQNIPKETS